MPGTSGRTVLGDSWKGWIRPAVWVGLAVCFGVAVYLLTSGIVGASRSSDLDERGVEVPADVLDVSVDPGGETGPSSVVTVRFKVRGDERTIVTTDVAYGDDFEADHPRSRRKGVRIEYDPDDPEHARLVGESGDSVDRIVAGSVFLVLITGSAIVLWRKPEWIL